MTTSSPRPISRTPRLAEGLDRIAAAIGRVPPWPAAIVIVAGIALLGVLGHLHRNDPASTWFLDGEDSLPAVYSGGLLTAAALVTGLVGWSRRDLAGHGWWLVTGAIFGFMALDEVWTLHEILEGSTGVDWQLWYAPVMLLAGVACLKVLRDLLPLPGAASLFAAGAVAWLASQLLENLQWEGDVLLHPGSILPEELLEMSGSMLLGLGALVMLRRELRSRAL